MLDAEAAKAAALFLTSLEPPVNVKADVTYGMSSELFRGPLGMCGSEDQCRARDARRQRLAWRVDLTGMAPGSDCEEAICPLVLKHQILVIDELDGSVLYSVESEADLGF